jgi:hypothetical protein
MDGSRCWHGKADGGAGGLAKKIEGCLKVGDQLRPWDRLWDSGSSD